MHRWKQIATLCVAAGVPTVAGAAFQETLEAEAARLSPTRVERIAEASLAGGAGVSLRAGIAQAPDDAPGEPDLVFTSRIPSAGRYSIATYAAVDDATAARMRAARSKFESLFVAMRIDRRAPTRRVVYVPWETRPTCYQHVGVFDLEAGEREISFWLPPGLRLDRISIFPHRPPAIPPEAAAYQPPVLPPREHPRLWLGPATIGAVRANLDHPEHAAHWKRVRERAAKPFPFAPPADRELGYNTALEHAALAKAFCHAVAGDARAGREAADLMLAYLPRVEFGNVLDITREVGAAIYAGSCVYDWCHDLLAPGERDVLRRHLLRLAESMECGWPPFRQSIVNGHGNEAQICRDLLSMGIALHDDDPVPYRHCAYQILEQLVPMRRFEYRSPRHNQGVSYSAYRFGWEMHAAWLMRRLAGREVFDPNIKTVPDYWLHMRLPDGEMFRDGDGVPSGPYWRWTQTALLCYSYGANPVVKGEFIRQGGLRDADPILFLLLNDPALRPEPDLASLPATIDFGPVLGGMIARTGWTMGPDSPEVVAEVKGGGFHFGNHQHADAGSFQIYYRGLQAAKLAQYKFYGTEYDTNYAKRSVAQSMVFVLDPDERFPGARANDGGSRSVRTCPRTPRQAMDDPLFHHGKVIACSFGPSQSRPAYSYFSADLRGAYSAKVKEYVRQFCFLNLGRPGNPAAIIVRDDLTASDPAFKKFWQINTLKPPRKTASGARLWNSAGAVRGYLDVNVIEPAADARAVEFLEGQAANSVFGMPFTPPTPDAPEANGTRILISPRAATARDRFLVILQACDAEPLPARCEEADGVILVRVADRIAALASGTRLVDGPFEIVVPEEGAPYQILCAGLRAGPWRISAPGQPERVATVEPGRHTLAIEARAGRARFAPGARD